MERVQFFNESELKQEPLDLIEDYKCNFNDSEAEDQNETDNISDKMELLDAEHIKCEIDIEETVLYDGYKEVSRDYCEQCIKKEIETVEGIPRINESSLNSKAPKCEETKPFRFEDSKIIKSEEMKESENLDCRQNFECDKTENSKCDSIEEEEDEYNKSIQEQENQNLAEDKQFIILFIVQNGEQVEPPKVPVAQSKVLRSRRISFEQEQPESESYSSIEEEIAEERPRNNRRKTRTERTRKLRKRKRDNM